MTENLKRFRIEFTVDVHHEGVTKDWDYSNDDIKDFALQELECMSPYPFNITFSEVDDPWHTELPTEVGWYLTKTEASDYSVHYFDGEKWDFCPLDFVKSWQKISEED